MRHLLVIKFKDAGLFSKNRKDSGDKVFYNELKFGRGKKITTKSVINQRDKEKDWHDVPPGMIGKSQIKNLFRVMIGERPVPSHRPFFPDDYSAFAFDGSTSAADELASRALVRVDNFIDAKKDGTQIYAYEKMTMRKAMWNSWNTTPYTLNMSWGPMLIKGVYPSWEKIKCILGNLLYDEFRILAKDIVGNLSSRKLASVLEELSYHSDERKESFIQKLKDNDKTPFAYILAGGVPTAQGINQGKEFWVPTVPFAVSNVARLSGQIFIELSSEELELFRRGTPATFLDGGFVNIDGIYNSDEYLFENLIPEGAMKPYECVQSVPG